MTIRADTIGAGSRLARSALISAAGGLVLLLLAAAALDQLLSLSRLYLPKVVAGYGVAIAIILVFLPAHRPHLCLGPANQVTLFRALLTALLFGLVGEGGTASIAWVAFLIALLAELLDGVDGWLARRGGWVSMFGARLDMETDALLIAVLALLVWSLGKAGVWVLVAGLLRYAFVSAAFLLPWMRRTLPPSRRRQTACVVQVLTLTVGLVPFFPAYWTAVVAGAGLAVLCYSFAVDTLWLVRRAGLALEAREQP